jgi:hypothetical protein
MSSSTCQAEARWTSRRLRDLDRRDLRRAVTGIAFLYEPVIPDGTLGGVPVDLIELQREENSKIASDAISRFEAGVKKAGVARKRASSMPPSAAPPRCSLRSRGVSTSPSSRRRSANRERPTS